MIIFMVFEIPEQEPYGTGIQLLSVGVLKMWCGAIERFEFGKWISDSWRNGEPFAVSA